MGQSCLSAIHPPSPTRIARGAQSATSLACAESCRSPELLLSYHQYIKPMQEPFFRSHTRLLFSPRTAMQMIVLLRKAEEQQDSSRLIREESQYSRKEASWAKSHSFTPDWVHKKWVWGSNF